MPTNKGYLTAKTNKASDEQFTPDYAVRPLIKYIPEDAVIWCPFDRRESAFMRLFTEAGRKVIYSHIDEGKNFFFYEPNEHYDIIISNPPFSQKDNVLKRLYELGKPYAMLLPVPTLQGQERFPYIKDGLQYLGFDKRINYYEDEAMTKVRESAPFASCYLCKKFLPRDLIIEELNK